MYVKVIYRPVLLTILVLSLTADSLSLPNLKEVIDTLELGSLNVQVDSDVASELWSPGLSPKANLKRYKAIRAGLLHNLNESVNELDRAMKKKDAKEAQYLLQKLNEKWRKLEELQKNIIQLIPDDDLDVLTEETRLFEENRDVVDRQREEAHEFITQSIRVENIDIQSTGSLTKL